MGWLRAGKRRAVLLTAGAMLPDLDGFDVVATEAGLFIYDRQQISQAEILEAVKQDRIGWVLGYGLERKPLAGTEVGSVVVRAKNPPSPQPSPPGEGARQPASSANGGYEKQAVVTDEGHLANALAAAKEVADPDDTVGLESSQDIVDERRGLPRRFSTRFYPVVRPLRDDEDLRRLQMIAAEDNHRVIAPTYVIELDGEIVGYLGINSMPMYQGWFHTKKMGPGNSAQVFTIVEHKFRMDGHKFVGLLLPETSPFAGGMARFGYEKVATVGLEVKRL